MLSCRHRLSASCGAPTIPQNYVGYSLPYEQERKPCDARLFACIPPPRPPKPPPQNAPPCSPAGWRLRHHTPANHRICRPHRITAPLGPPLLRACAGPEPGSNLPHGTRRVCCARRPGDANGNAAQTGGLVRQVRQRMNRLGKPEHRARFCFFSKKKSPAGMRRFPITLEIQIPMGFNRSAASFATPKTFLQSPPFAGAKRQPHPLKPPHLPPDSHHHTPRSHSYCAHAQGQSRVRACRTLREACAAPAA